MNIGFHFTYIKTQECFYIFKSLSLTAIYSGEKKKTTFSIIISEKGNMLIFPFLFP